MMTKLQPAMHSLATRFDDVHALKLRVFEDCRGRFVKSFHADIFRELGLFGDFRESYFSVSTQNTLRGMHFQIPPEDHVKLATIVSGRILDVVLCLRRNDPNYGKSFAIELAVDGPAQAIHIPSGYAHGFLALSDEAIVQYMTSTVHSPACDCGVRWDSFGFPWPVDTPILSDRDLAHPPLAEFNSPFAQPE